MNGTADSDRSDSGCPDVSVTRSDQVSTPTASAGEDCEPPQAAARARARKSVDRRHVGASGRRIGRSFQLLGAPQSSHPNRSARSCASGAGLPAGGITQWYTWSRIRPRELNTAWYDVKGIDASCPPGEWHERQRFAITPATWFR